MTPTVDAAEPRLSGRQAQAARNDGRILAAAREVFTEDPKAPIQAVAARAGVGMSALYRRYPSKEALLAALCADGLTAYVAELERAVADEGEPWAVFAAFLQRVVDAGSGSLTRRLAGTFTPPPELFAVATRAQELGRQLLDRLHAARVLRADVTIGDLGMVYELMAAVRLGDETRTRDLQHRYLAVLLDGLRARPDAAAALPAAPPTDQELIARWRR